MSENEKMSSCIRWWIAALFLAAVLTGAASAQQNAPDPKPGANAPATARGQAPSPAGVSPKPVAQPALPVNTEQALYLVRSNLLTLNDANRSGNYTVFHDLAAPDFQSRNSAADLAQSFSDLRRRNFDLFAAALLSPRFSSESSLDANGKMRLTGFFPTRPLRISFDLTFQSVGGQWRLFAISVATPEAPTTQSQINRPDVNRASPRRSAVPFYGFRILSGSAGLRF